MELSWSQSVELNHPLEEAFENTNHRASRSGSWFEPADDSQEPFNNHDFLGGSAAAAGSSSSNHHPPPPPLSSSGTQQPAADEVLTQNPDASLTQLLGDSQSQLSPLSPTCGDGSSKPQPWGRLLPCGGGGDGAVHPLWPRPPSNGASRNNENNNDSMQQLRPSDIFNLHTLGRSTKCDVPAVPPCATTMDDNPKRRARREWAFGLISNRHCQIYCCLDEDAASINTSSSSNSNHNHWAAYVEDCSGNGTTVNQTVTLRRGEKRRLHSGDEICLVNRQTLQKKIRSPTELQRLLQPHSYVFCWLPHSPLTTQPTHPTQHTAAAAAPSLLAEVTGRHPCYPQNSNNSNNNSSNNRASAAATASGGSQKRCAAVNARATHQHHRSPPPPPPLDSNIDDDSRSNDEAGRFPPPPPRRHRHGHGNNPSSNNSAMMSPLCSSNDSNNHAHKKRQQQPQQPQQRRYIQQDYDLRDVLGRGTVGTVRRAIHRATGAERAVKIVAPPRHFAGGRALVAANAATVRVEAELLRQLRHPYVVRLVDVYASAAPAAASSGSGSGNSNGFQQQQQKQQPPTYYLVMELLHGGDLFDRIVQKGRYSEADARRVLRRLLNALYYLHERCNVVHRDLKPENILLCSQRDDVSVKLTDFGLAKEVYEADGLKTFCGTPAYFAPEVLSRRNTVHGRGRYGKPADLWSLGVILYVLLTGMPPFDDDDDDHDHHDGDNHPYPRPPTVEFPNDVVVSAAAQDLVRQLLQPDPAKRWTVRQACEHPWILHDGGDDTHVHPLADPLWTERTVAGNDEEREEPVKTTTAVVAAAETEKSSSSEPTANETTVDDATVPAKVSGAAVAVAKSAAETEPAAKDESKEELQQPQSDSTVEASSSSSCELKKESAASPTACEPAPAIESLDREEREPSGEDEPPREESTTTTTTTPSPFPPLPPVFDTETTSKRSQQEKPSTRVQRVSAVNYSFRPAPQRQSMAGIIPISSSSSTKKKQPPASPPPSSSVQQQQRRPLSPLAGNDEDAAAVGKEEDDESALSNKKSADNENSKKRFSVEASFLLTSSITPGTSSHARRAVPPSFSSSLRDPKQPPSEASALVVRGEEEDRLELSDDEILSRFSENTDSISSFSSTVAERDRATIVGSDGASNAQVKVDENNLAHVEAAAVAATSSSKNKKKAKSSTKRLAATKTTGAAKSKKRKTAVTTKKSPSAKSKKEATGGGGKQTTLNKWFKKND